jgi:hypothetical protein
VKKNEANEMTLFYHYNIRETEIDFNYYCQIISVFPLTHEVLSYDNASRIIVLMNSQKISSLGCNDEIKTMLSSKTKVILKQIYVE